MYPEPRTCKLVTRHLWKVTNLKVKDSICVSPSLHHKHIGSIKRSQPFVKADPYRRLCDHFQFYGARATLQMMNMGLFWSHVWFQRPWQPLTGSTVNFKETSKGWFCPEMHKLSMVRMAQTQCAFLFNCILKPIPGHYSKTSHMTRWQHLIATAKCECDYVA